MKWQEWIIKPLSIVLGLCLFASVVYSFTPEERKEFKAKLDNPDNWIHNYIFKESNLGRFCMEQGFKKPPESVYQKLIENEGMAAWTAEKKENVFYIYLIPKPYAYDVWLGDKPFPPHGQPPLNKQIAYIGYDLTTKECVEFVYWESGFKKKMEFKQALENLYKP